MKKITCIMAFLIFIFVFENYRSDLINANNEHTKTVSITSEEAPTEKIKNSTYHYPDFYRGIYLTVESGRSLEKLKHLVDLAKKAYINTFVIDVQSSHMKKCMIPAEYVQFLLQNGIHPVARIVMFPDGLRDYPVSKELLNNRYTIAIEACENGFKEIQFDYIRFNDSSRLKYVSLNDRYAFIEGIFTKAREILGKYSVRIAADVFGRIPLNHGDLIGQRMEGLDKVADVICPMAYPSHYTWSKKMQYDPYYTVFVTSKQAKERTKSAEIVTYIQAFKMKLGTNDYSEYIAAQIKAVHDSGVKGFIMWNARQEYELPLTVARNYYLNKISKSDTKKTEDIEKTLVR